MYVKTHQGVIQKYPYSIGDLQADNPQVSFPESFLDALLASYEVFPVAPTTKPLADHTKNVVEGSPTNQAGKWTQTWAVTQATASEISARTAQCAIAVRVERDARLAACDWTQTVDSAFANDPAWKAYRQGLRDIPGQPGFPWAIRWPTKPF